MSKFKSKLHTEQRLKKLYKFNDVGLGNACVYCGDKNDNPDFSLFVVMIFGTISYLNAANI